MKRAIRFHRINLNLRTLFRLDVAVKDRQTGKRVWQGQAYADISGGDPLTITEALLRPLMDSFGKTVRRNKFQVQ